MLVLRGRELGVGDQVLGPEEPHPVPAPPGDLRGVGRPLDVPQEADMVTVQGLRAQRHGALEAQAVGVVLLLQARVGGERLRVGLDHHSAAVPLHDDLRALLDAL